MNQTLVIDRKPRNLQQGILPHICTIRGIFVSVFNNFDPEPLLISDSTLHLANYTQF